ncbi:MAG: 4-hydroxybenzoate octaprenyltransferase [Legionellales bacterium]|nr:4-hydroxybenzoate octaprenyltransferase [Legionellales bacterium]OUX65968.1 MAG: 4-hydroxybenzoate polyprenyltransferase [Gammaproteobacteria bacterium TMED281]|tara:strand:- start:439 stop:1278 length:840 start_codon:yes stop_codon:yes gene_type:complete
MSLFVPYLELMRLKTPIGFWLLWWPTSWALWVATKGTQLKLWCIFIVGTWIMRSAGCVINDWFDKDIDPFVERTKQRPLAKGTLKSPQALNLFGMLMLGAFFLCLMLPMPARLLCVVGAIMTGLYPLAKRFTHCPQIMLGCTFAMSIPIVFAATEQLQAINIWLPIYFAAVLWPLAYDSIYALEDFKDDKKLNIHSSPQWLEAYTMHFIILSETLTFSMLAILGIQQQLSWPFWMVLGGIMSSFIVMLFILIPRQYFISLFKVHHWFGCLIFLGLIISS